MQRKHYQHSSILPFKSSCNVRNHLLATRSYLYSQQHLQLNSTRFFLRDSSASTRRGVHVTYLTYNRHKQNGQTNNDENQSSFFFFTTKGVQPTGKQEYLNWIDKCPPHTLKKTMMWCGCVIHDGGSGGRKIFQISIGVFKQCFLR